LNSLLEECDYILPLHPRALEPLRPLHEAAAHEALLPTREREREAEGKVLHLEVVIPDETGETVGDVVKELEQQQQRQDTK